MAKIEKGRGKLLSVDTEKRTLRFQKIGTRIFDGSPPREWEHPYSLEWKDQLFFDLVGKPVEYILSDGTIVSLKSAS